MTSERTDLKCPECGARMQLLKTRFGFMYGCTRYPNCDCTHGAHPDGAPLGTPANKETKQARIAAHAAFDELWKGCMSEYPKAGKRNASEITRMARRRCYAWLAERLGLDSEACHIGQFDIATCKRVVAACEGVTYAEVRRWFKAQKPTGGREVSA